ncbi:T-cell surface glycoprotein CD3 delta chain-like isoform X2 [Heterodontus francisci]|uniref:T-cell surface glycoprotein CD3 delta chain-like isoform X2 n=1 Tax=Heterodontus francisci TaxID=7792 RepID=UPI00355C522B
MQCQKFPIIVTSLTILLFGTTNATITIHTQEKLIKVHCEKANLIVSEEGKNPRNTSISHVMLKYSDEHSVEYSCLGDLDNRAIIFIKLCQNCLHVDPGTTVGIVIGDLIATILIAVAVYCISSASRVKVHQASDRQALVLNEANTAIYSGIDQVDRQEYNRLEHRNKK